MFVCNSEQKLLKSDSIYESYVRMKKGPVFFLTHSVDGALMRYGLSRSFNFKSSKLVPIVSLCDFLLVFLCNKACIPILYRFRDAATPTYWSKISVLRRFCPPQSRLNTTQLGVLLESAVWKLCSKHQNLPVAENHTIVQLLFLS